MSFVLAAYVSRKDRGTKEAGGSEIPSCYTRINFAIASNILQFQWNILDRAQHLRDTFPPCWIQFVFIQQTVWGFGAVNR